MKPISYTLEYKSCSHHIAITFQVFNSTCHNLAIGFHKSRGIFAEVRNNINVC